MSIYTLSKQRIPQYVCLCIISILDRMASVEEKNPKIMSPNLSRAIIINFLEIFKIALSLYHKRKKNQQQHL